jgi:hypothetical protein
MCPWTVVCMCMRIGMHNTDIMIIHMHVFSYIQKHPSYLGGPQERGESNLAFIFKREKGDELGSDIVWAVTPAITPLETESCRGRRFPHSASFRGCDRFGESVLY